MPHETLERGRAAEIGRGVSRVEWKRERRRADIIQAALEAVRVNGYHATTLDDIADRIGVRKGALYHYFQDKDAILLACHRESLRALDRIVASSRTLDSPAAQLEYLVREHVRVMAEQLAGSPLALEVTSLPPEARREVIEGRDRFEAELRAVVREGIRQGEFREVDPKIVVFALLGAVNWIARWYRPGGTITAGDLGAVYADYLVGGLRPLATDAPSRRSRSEAEEDAP